MTTEMRSLSDAEIDAVAGGRMHLEDISLGVAGGATIAIGNGNDSASPESK